MSSNIKDESSILVTVRCGNKNKKNIEYDTKKIIECIKNNEGKNINVPCNYVNDIIVQNEELKIRLDYWIKVAKKLANNPCINCHVSSSICPKNIPYSNKFTISTCRMKRACEQVEFEYMNENS